MRSVSKSPAAAPQGGFGAVLLARLHRKSVNLFNSAWHAAICQRTRQIHEGTQITFKNADSSTDCE